MLGRSKGLFSGINAGMQQLGSGPGTSLNKKKPMQMKQQQVLGQRPAEEMMGDFTIEDPRLNRGAPTNVPSQFGNLKNPFAKNDPRYRDWIVKNALKSRKRFKAFENLEAAMEAAKSYVG